MMMLPAPAARSKLRERAHPGVRLPRSFKRIPGSRRSIGPRYARCQNAV
jgi:hypothetical protein